MLSILKNPVTEYESYKGEEKIIFFPYSDDNIEIRGLFYDEIGCYSLDIEFSLLYNEHEILSFSINAEDEIKINHHNKDLNLELYITDNNERSMLIVTPTEKMLDKLILIGRSGNDIVFTGFTKNNPLKRLVLEDKELIGKIRKSSLYSAYCDAEHFQTDELDFLIRLNRELFPQLGFSRMIGYMW